MAQPTTKRAKRTTKGAKRATSAAQQASPAANAALAGRAALAGTKAAGRAVVSSAERAGTPLIVGGAAAAGVIGGVLVHRRAARSPDGFTGISNLVRDGKLDLDVVAGAARRAGAMGQQLGEIGTAIERVERGKK